MRHLRLRAAAAAPWLLLMVAGCAPLPPVGSSTPPANVPSASTGARAAPATPARTQAIAAPIDSTPSAEALGVLASIPEPLGPGERVAPPERGVPTVPDDSTTVDSGGADVPVPSPTQPLGERRHSATDTTVTTGPGAGSGAVSGGSPTGGPVSAPAGGAAAGGSSAPTSPPASSSRGASASGDTCWRIQVLAPLDPNEAEQARATASSQLLTPMVVEPEAHRYKVRTRDCLTRTAADLLRRRAIDSGFTQAFRIMGPGGAGGAGTGAGGKR